MISSSSSSFELPLIASLNSRMPVADRLADLGQALGAEDDQGDDEHDHELERADVEWHLLASLRMGSVRVAPGRQRLEAHYHQTVESRFSISSTGRV